MSQSLSLAQDVAWNLATTLMVCVTLFKADIGFGVLPTSKFDGGPDSVIHDYDSICVVISAAPGACGFPITRCPPNHHTMSRSKSVMMAASSARQSTSRGVALATSFVSALSKRAMLVSPFRRDS